MYVVSKIVVVGKSLQQLIRQRSKLVNDLAYLRPSSLCQHLAEVFAEQVSYPRNVPAAWFYLLMLLLLLPLTSSDVSYTLDPFSEILSHKISSESL